MIYIRLFTILLAASFIMIVFYGDLATVTSLLAGLCGGFVAVVAAQNNTVSKLKTLEKRVDALQATAPPR
jgi:predicted MFS family arabinose efflux permease